MLLLLPVYWISCLRCPCQCAAYLLAHTLGRPTHLHHGPPLHPDAPTAVPHPPVPGVRHQREAATGYFDSVMDIVSGGQSSTTALKGSTEANQF